MVALSEVLLADVFGFAKIGAIRLVSRVVFITTLGSHRIQDAPYSMAALDPSPFLLMLTVAGLSITAFVLTLSPLIDFFAGRAAEHVLRRSRQAFLKDDAANGDAYRAHIRSTTKKLLLGAGTLIAVQLLLLAIGLSVVGKAIEVRRVFVADVAILAPYIETRERLQLESDFAGMSSKQAFQKIKADLERLAASYKLTLRNEGGSL